MKRASVVVCILALAACQPAVEPGSEKQSAAIPAPPAAGGCEMQASRDWSAVGSQYYVIEAESRGESCREATVTIRIESQEGQTLFTRDYQAAQVPLAFNPNSDPTGTPPACALNWKAGSPTPPKHSAPASCRHGPPAQSARRTSSLQ